ncbi:MAG: stage III sporulation protein AE [Clostridiales bacterium]|nr:stage III sporulation protein AE [Clostridiales bacterium]
MEYETIIEKQLEDMELSEYEELVNDSIGEARVFEEVTADEIIDNLINGQPLFDSDKLLDNLLNLLLMEVKSALFMGCEILIVCIIIGVLSGVSNSFGKKAVSTLGSTICVCIIISLCIGSFYQSYNYCQDSMDTMTNAMKILLPVMIPLLIATGGVSSGSILNPVIIGAVTGFNTIMQHVVLPLVFLSALFVLLNSLTEKDYVKKLSVFLRRMAIFITGLLITVFTGITAIQGIVTKSADGILMNTARFSLDNFVPIVGGFAADSLDMVISCMGLIKNTLGIMGMIAIASLLIMPVIKLITIALVYKVTAIVAEPIASKNISDSLNEIGTSAITMSVVLGLGALMFLIFITIMMGLGGGSLWK